MLLIQLVSFWGAGLELAGGAVNVADGLSEGGELLDLVWSGGLAWLGLVLGWSGDLA